MQLISIEKLTGAKRLHRKYTILNGELFEFSRDHEELKNTDNTNARIFEFKVEDEEAFKFEVEEYRQRQKAALSKIARKENTVTIKEIDAEQGTKEWLAARVGLITASKTPFDVKGNPIPTFNKYVWEKVADAFMKNNGVEPEDTFTSEAMERGTKLEHYALERYEEVTQNQVDTRSLLIADNLMVGASPDGVVERDGMTINVEVKSVLLKSYIGELQANYVSNNYMTQVQVQMFMLNSDLTHFVVQCQQVSGEPLDIIIREIRRDEEFISNMIETIKKYEREFRYVYGELEEQIIV